MNLPMDCLQNDNRVNNLFRRNLPAGAILCALLSACSFGASPAVSGGAQPGLPALRLGYFPNLTHAPALVGIETGLFEQKLRPVANLELKSFNAGPSAVEGLFAEAIDATYIGPGPAINGFSRSGGEAVRIVSGATEGGAALVVQRSINTPQDLKGTKVASPQLGNTQDIALRTWLRSHGLRTTLQGGGEVSVVPGDNAQTLDAFRLGQISGAWLPEPWATRLVEEAGAKVLVDERTLWPQGRFPSTVLVVHPAFSKREPAALKALLGAHIEAVDRLNTDREPSLRAVNKVLGRELLKPLPPSILKPAAEKLHFTTEIIPSSLGRIAKDAKALGLLDNADLEGAFQLTPLNEIASSPSPKRTGGE